MKTRLLFAFIFSVVFSGCTKSDDEPEQPKPDQISTLDFDISGNRGIYQNLTFKNTSGSSGTFTWKLGDGKTATGTTVNHSFTKTGSFTVTLYRNYNGVTDSVSKNLQIDLGLSSLAGNFTWGKERYVYNAATNSTTVLPDTTLQLSLVNATTLRIMNFDCVYEPNNSQQNNYLLFRTTGSPSTTSTIRYYHQPQQLTFQDRTQAGLGAGIVYNYTKK